MLTGQNGILNRAAEAKEKTDTASKEEQRKLAQAEALMNTDETTYKGITLPEGFAPTKIEGEDSIDDGLVITDGYGNEYVWVEVPKKIYADSQYNINGEPSSSTDYEKIEKCLKVYTKDYSDSNYSDTAPNYLELYQNMLKSVYENGGFWIARYEAGTSVNRTSYDMLKSNKIVFKPNMYPYTYIKRDEAQKLAIEMNYKNCNSSLLFGIQWDLTLKYIESKNESMKSILISDSTTVGNYYNSEFLLNRGKFAVGDTLSNWYDFNSEDKKEFVTSCKKKGQDSYVNRILLTTGATEVTKMQNIYDMAGNVYEWTLEFYNESDPGVSRGGSCNYSGKLIQAKNRGNGNIENYYDELGFRIGLWK